MYEGEALNPLWERWFISLWRATGFSPPGGTGVAELIAGANISINPSVGTGIVTISSAAASGFFALDGLDGEEGMPIPGPPGASGTFGGPGPQGIPGIGLDGADPDEFFIVPGPAGAAGAAGAPGSVGPQGMIGIGLDGADADDLLHLPGPAGAAGAQGPIGPQGMIGIGLDGADGDEGMPIPGPLGPTGLQGLQGLQGIPGIGFDGADADDLLHIPGQTGSTGATGAQGIPGIGLDGADPDESMSALRSLDGIVLGNISRLVINGPAIAVGDSLLVFGGFTGAGTLKLITFSDAANTNGVNIKLIGNGASTPSKTFRVQGGNFEWLNDAYNAVLARITDAGALNLPTGPASATITNALTGVAAFKPSDTTATSNALAADATLSLTFNEIGKYAFELWLPFYEATVGTGGFQFDLSSGSATVGAIVYGVDGFSTASIINAGVTSVATATSAATISTSASAPSWFFANGWFSITVAGTLVPRWAQASTLLADPTTLKAGAYFTATKIG
jgi:hypothetical protein